MLFLFNRVKSETARFYLFSHRVYRGLPLLPEAGGTSQKVKRSLQTFAARQDAQQEEQEEKNTQKVLAHQSLRGQEQDSAAVYYRDKATS